MVNNKDAIVEKDRLFSKIQFADKIQMMLDYIIRKIIHIRLQGRPIDYKAMFNRISATRQPQRDFQVINLENDYFAVKFVLDYDYINVLTEGL
ncbi:hypothetical protein GQ457_04G014570 [Hibiscus cannabinus]